MYVGGLSWETSGEGLRQAFAKYGEVTDARVITDRETGRSRGFGFVTFAQEQDAMAAMAEMNGSSLDGRSIKVDEAQERKRRGGGRGGGFRGGAGGPRGRRGRW